MARLSTTRAAVVGRQRAARAAASLGQEVRASRLRRKLTQKVLATKTGVSRSQIAKIETGRGVGVRAAEWFALADALGRYLRFELARDQLAAPVDAGHLDIQQLVLRLARQAGFDDRHVELPGRSGSGWTDVGLVRRASRTLALIECVNTVGDLGASFRSSDRKFADAVQLAAALGGEGPEFRVAMCWVVRDTQRNRELVVRYEHIFEARFPGSSLAWVRAMTNGGPLPEQAGLIWCDRVSSRLFARRPPRQPTD